MQLVEADAKTRVRKAGRDDDRVTGELLYADFIHQTARPVDGHLPDCHLHAHVYCWNVTYDPVEHCYKAGQFGDIKRDMPYYQARFHKILSDKLIGLGYQVRRTAKAFEVVGVPTPVLALFSKRTNEIGQIAKANGVTSPKALDALGARTRAKKQKGLTLEQLKENWRLQILNAGMAEAGSGSGVLRYAPPEHLPSVTALDCVSHALLARFERASVARDRRILETAYRYAIGRPDVSAAAITDSFRKDRRIIHVREKSGLFCTTKEVLAEEKRLVHLARKDIGGLQPLYLSAPPLNLAGDGGAAVTHVLTTPDRVSIIRGGAGTGKTTLMQEAVPLIEKAIGKPAVIVAPTAEAARGVLRQEGFINAETVAKLLTTAALQKQLQNGLLWVDEAGLLGVHDMAALLALADRHNARVVFAGDTRQHSAVVRGDGLRILSTVAGIRAAEVSRIYRQRNTIYREAVQALADGNAKAGFAKLEAMGAIRPLSPDQPYAGLADQYVSAVKKKKSVLAVCPTHSQGEAVTAAIRHKLKQGRMIGQKDKTFQRLVNGQLTIAARKDGQSYLTGQVILFSRNCAGFRRGSVWVVCEASGHAVTVQDKTGNKAALPLDKAKGFEVYNRAEISLAKGDSIRVTRNGQDAGEKRLNNGQTMDVTGFDRNGNIKARNPISKAEYLLPGDYGHIAHAYCLTSHGSQGKTVDEVLIAQPAATFPATSLKQFYVSVSRARDALHIYTDDPASLMDHASELGDRVSAMELLNRKRITQEAAERLAREQTPRPVTPSKQTHKPVRVHVRPVL